jgi:hypothetical protein
LGQHGDDSLNHLAHDEQPHPQLFLESAPALTRGEPGA